MTGRITSDCAALVHLSPFGMHKPSRFGRTKLRYVFTIEDAHLTCNASILQPAVPGVQPLLSLVWKSSKKTAYGGSVPALLSSGDRAAEWTRPVSLACSVYQTTRSGQQKFDSRNSELTLKVVGAAGSKRKLTGSLDLAPYASFKRQTNNVTVPLAHGAGTLHLTLSSMWLKRAAGLGKQESRLCSTF